MPIDSYRLGEKNHFLKAILIILCIAGFISLLFQAVIAFLIFVIAPLKTTPFSHTTALYLNYIAHFSPLSTFIIFILTCLSLIQLLRKGYVTQGSFFSRLLFTVALGAVLILLVLPLLLQWLYPVDCTHVAASTLGKHLCSIQHLGYSIRIPALLLELVPYLIFSYGCFIIIQLFRNYEKGQVFIHENIALYTKVGWSALLWAILKPASQMLQTFVLSLPKGPGHYLIHIFIQENSYIAGFIGLLIVIISYVMREGTRLQEQEDYTV